MGQMKFAAPSPYLLPSHVVDRAQLVSIDAIPWVTNNRSADNLLVLERDSNESARLVIPWQVPGFGEYLLQTATIPERSQPYLLPLELARGEVSRLREHLLPEFDGDGPRDSPVYDHLREATWMFVRAATAGPDLAATCRHAERCLQLCLEAIELWEQQEQAASQVLAERRRGERPTTLAIQLDQVPADPLQQQMLQGSFNTLMVVADWRRTAPQPQKLRDESIVDGLQWSQRQNWRAGCGPLLTWKRHVLPDWIYLWEDDFDALQSQVVEHVSALVSRFRNTCQIWHVASSANLSHGIQLTDEQRLQLAAAAVDAARRAAPEAERIVSFDQPWGEYLARQYHEAAPLDYADALVRSNVGLTALGLEINLGYWPDGSARRDAIEIARLVDLWSRFGLPLYFWLSIPSDSARDPLARLASQPTSLRLNEPSPQFQADTAERLILQLLAYESVRGICWSHWSDATPHEFPHGGLINGQGGGKPALESLKTIRAWYSTGADHRGSSSKP